MFLMVIDMDETRLKTVPQLWAFLTDTLEVAFTIPESDDWRYTHIVCDLKPRYKLTAFP